jgi:hypothetical protein
MRDSDAKATCVVSAFFAPRGPQKVPVGEQTAPMLSKNPNKLELRRLEQEDRPGATHSPAGWIDD